MTWKDSRIQFTNLKYFEETLLFESDVEKLWLPVLIFEGTVNNDKTLRDDLLVVKGYSLWPKVNKDLSAKRSDVLNDGYYTDLISERIYNEIFACEMDLQWYPFNVQKCNITMKLPAHQDEFVQLQPKQSFPIPLDGELSNVGQFHIVRVEQIRPSEFNATKIVVQVLMKRSPWKTFTATYIPTIALLIIVQLSFYFPEDNFQVRATVVLSSFLILATLLSGLTDDLPDTSSIIYLQIWIIFAVVLTFVNIVLQTAVGYLRTLEKKEDKFTTSKVNDVSICIKVNHAKSKKYGEKARKLNNIGGRIITSIVLALFTVSYFAYALNNYYNDV